MTRPNVNARWVHSGSSWLDNYRLLIQGDVGDVVIFLPGWTKHNNQKLLQDLRFVAIIHEWIVFVRQKFARGREVIVVMWTLQRLQYTHINMYTYIHTYIHYITLHYINTYIHTYRHTDLHYITLHYIPYIHTYITYHYIPYHTIPHHTIPYHTYIHNIT